MPIKLANFQGLMVDIEHILAFLAINVLDNIQATLPRASRCTVSRTVLQAWMPIFVKEHIVTEAIAPACRTSELLE
jgi:hypothetical protein